MRKAHDPDEILDLVDEKDNVIGKITRKEAHEDMKLHREASVFVMNAKGEILIQERLDTGKLEYSASGHFPSGETYLDGIVRETREEIGLDLKPDDFKAIIKYRLDSYRFVTLFETKGNYEITDFKIDPKEVKSIKFYSIQELEEIVEIQPERMGSSLKESLKIYFAKNNGA
ncbi:MAG: NUDIX domain-containing protein [Candidatus Micrarchaeales archaeon]|jgi:isopentenyldiphosphate isomerase